MKRNFSRRTASARSLRLIGQTRVAWKLADNRIPWNMPRETPLLDVWRKFQLARPDLVSN